MKLRPIPEGIDLTRSNVELSFEYTASVNTIQRWRKEAGVVKKPGGVRRANPMPEGIDLTQSLNQIAVAAGVSETTAQTWKRKAGIPPNPPGSGPRHGLPRPAYAGPAVPGDKQQVSFMLPTGVVLALKELCSDQEMNMTDMIIKLIQGA